MKQIPANVYLIFFLLFGALLLGKLFYLQVVKGEYYGALAMGQQIPVEETNSQRGTIFFNDGKTILAQTVISPIVYISPSKIPQEEKEQTIQKLSEILGDTIETITLQIDKGETIKKELTTEQYKAFKQENLKGVYIDEIFNRVYPNKKFASQLVGFVNGEGNGQYGIESFYNNTLKGEDFLKGKNTTFSIISSVFKTGNEITQTLGKDLQLTIDYNIQYYAQKLLEEAFNEWQMDSGQIMVEEPSTGKILAMAVWPTYDPNQYGQEKNVSVFSNPCIQGLFEPGSVFKPVVMAGGLEEKLITPETTFFDSGSANVGGPSIYNFAKKAWGEQTMVGVLENSINTGMVFVEQKLGKTGLLKYIQKFGFFEKTGIDVAGETYSTNQALKNGYPRDFAVASFGQGIQITSLQMLQAISAIANEGKMNKPYVVEKIISSKGEVEQPNTTSPKQVISKNTAIELSAMMVSVVENGGGRRAKVPDYLVAGKTGTAQIPSPNGGYYEDRTIQSFVGFAPATSPKFAILIRMDNPKQSDAASSCAAPIFGKLAKYIIDLKQIPPTK
ncbi:MAG: penicillin-binding protein 2 [Candidatus Pacebacteria bacterium]|nr:penicillin-binding protein 2 [Candidatus Paceibacterota bacterium]